MSWRISITHTSTYRYSTVASASYNEVRMTPVSSGAQTLVDSRVSTAPGATLYRYRDYFGTTVHAFDVHEPHTELSVVSSSTVDTAPAEPLVAEIDFDALREPAIEDRMSEYLLATDYTHLNAELFDAARAETAGRTPAEAFRLLADFVRAQLRYEPGTTSATTPAVDAWRQKSGVCQDFAHLTIGLCRSLGIPARYVSGYLHPHADAAVGDTVEGASHAWVEAWLGGWLALDPTNGHAVDGQHVAVGRGRDYADVAPVRGIYLGGRLEELAVRVELTRLA